MTIRLRFEEQQLVVSVKADPDETYRLDYDRVLETNCDFYECKEGNGFCAKDTAASFFDKGPVCKCTSNSDLLCKLDQTKPGHDIVGWLMELRDQANLKNEPERTVPPALVKAFRRVYLSPAPSDD